MQNSPKRELLFSVTAGDCDWTYSRGSGAGGQKRNKTSSAVRCRHRDSGAVGYAEDTRSQRTNKEKAFERMANTEKFKNWHRLEVSRRTGEMERIERKVKEELKNIKLEIKDEDGRWVQVPKDSPLDMGVE